MRNIIYLSLTTMALTACSAFNQTPQHNAQHSNQGRYITQGQSINQAQPSNQSYGAYSQAPAQYRNPAYASQYNQASSYTQPSQYPQSSPYNGQHSGQNPALRGPHKAQGNGGYFYGTVGLVNYDTSIDNYGFEGRLGYQATKNFGAEVEGSIGVANDNGTFLDPAVGDVSRSIGFNGNAAAFGVARLPVSDRIAIHGRAGYDFRRIDLELQDELGNELNVSESLDGFAYGFGGEYAFTPRNRLRVDYTIYESELGSSDAVSVSYKHKF